MTATRDLVKTIVITDHNGCNFIDGSVLGLCVADGTESRGVSGAASDGGERRSDAIPESAGLWAVGFSTGDRAQKITLRQESDGKYLATITQGVHRETVISSDLFWWTVCRGEYGDSFRLCDDQGRYLQASGRANDNDGVITLCILPCTTTTRSASSDASSQRSSATSWVFRTSARHASRTQVIEESSRGRSPTAEASSAARTSPDGPDGSVDPSFSLPVLATAQESRSTSPTIVADDDDGPGSIIEEVQSIAPQKAVNSSVLGLGYLSSGRTASHVDAHATELKHHNDRTLLDVRKNVASNARLHQSCPPIVRPPNRVPTHRLPPRDVPRQEVPPQSAPPRRIPPQSIPPQIRPLQSVPLHRVPPQSVPPQNTPPQDIPAQSIPAQSIPPQISLAESITSPQCARPKSMPPRIVPPRNVPPKSVPPHHMPTQTVSWNATLFARFEAGGKVMAKK